MLKRLEDDSETGSILKNKASVAATSQKRVYYSSMFIEKITMRD